MRKQDSMNYHSMHMNAVAVASSIEFWMEKSCTDFRKHKFEASRAEIYGKCQMQSMENYNTRFYSS
ncbi:CLUMA_CG005837, isoform A [Clunio marinus]|uniref:CLUMA_CG005837, isoform A n=1 Tax=Clunio marinus TaxID=568069 RepID=A0A1J1HWA4_9DIPT|nr:CLUMA_CG005837, isoform A [Clunio marinus]